MRTSRLSELFNRYWRFIQITAALMTVAGLSLSYFGSYSLYVLIAFLLLYSILATAALRKARTTPIRQETSPPALGRVHYLLNEGVVVINTQRRVYEFHFTRQFRNEGDEPITKLSSRFYANAFPGDPVRSLDYYAKNALLWSDLEFRAWDDIGPLDIELVSDFNAVKDFLIHFSQHGVQRPIYRNETRTFHRTFTIPIEYWGCYLERTVLDPTDLVRVVISAPSPIVSFRVGGREIPPVGAAGPLRNQPKQSPAGANQIWVWEEPDPKLGYVYQIQWSEV